MPKGIPKTIKWSPRLKAAGVQRTDLPELMKLGAKDTASALSIWRTCQSKRLETAAGEASCTAEPLQEMEIHIVFRGARAREFMSKVTGFFS